MLEGSYNPNTKTSSVYTAGLEMAGDKAPVVPDVTSVGVAHRLCGAGLGWFADSRCSTTVTRSPCRNPR